MSSPNIKMEVAEAPGLYGTLKIEEKLIQKIWHNQEFIKENLQTTDGQTIKILNPGNWNLWRKRVPILRMPNFHLMEM